MMVLILWVALVVLVILKLAGAVAITWFWALSPILVPLSVCGILLVCLAPINLIAVIIATHQRRKRLGF